MGRAEEGCCMDHERLSVCESPATGLCSTEPLLALMQQVCHMKRIHTWPETTQWVQLPNSQWVLPPQAPVQCFPLTPDHSPPTLPPPSKPQAGSKWTENSHPQICLPPARGNWEFTGIHGTGGRSHRHYTPDATIYLDSWYFRVTRM